MRSLLKNKKKRRERLDSDLIKLEKRGKGKIIITLLDKGD